jgi:hypothetical protein
MATALTTLAGAISMKEQPKDTARLLGAAEATFERIGAFFQPSDKPEIDRITSAIRTKLGDVNFDETWAEGRRMDLEQAVEYALSN